MFMMNKKIYRKLKRCEALLWKYENILFAANLLRSLFVGNGGLGCGFSREMLLYIFADYGQIEKIVMCLEKPYAFIVFTEIEQATRAVSSINGKNLESGHVLYMSYVCDKDVPEEKKRKNSLPEGLVLLENFVTENEEKELLDALCLEAENIDELKEKSVLKHRKVKHFGYEFVYGSNNINKSKPLERKIPEVCMPHLEKLVLLNYLPRIPEQLTVNHYLPGQGIPPHVDTHSAFEDGIVSLSLSAEVVIDFYCSLKEPVSVFLPRRSALILLGESRYGWKHGITPRKTDIVTSPEGHLTLKSRSSRTSLTFRLIKDGPCNCDYKEHCDSQAL